MATSPLPFYTRTARTQDEKCRRSRYWLTECPTSKGKTGVVPSATSMALEEGILFHEVMTSVLLAKDPHVFELAVADAVDRLRVEVEWASERQRMEQTTMVEGLMRAAYRSVRPRILDEYDVIKVEQEMPFEHDGVVQGQKPDAILRRKADSALIQLDWKSSGLISPAFFNSWETAVQFQWGPVAITKHLGEPCEAVMIQVLYKGRMDGDDLSSIFAYGYAPATRPPGSKLSYAYVKGLRKYPVWLEPGGIKTWVEEMPDDILMKWLPETRPVSSKTAIVEASLRQAALREKQIARGSDLLQMTEQQVHAIGTEDWLETRQGIMDEIFPQSFSMCTPVVGFPCAYKPLCVNPVAARDPERHGFMPREPHHTSETKLENLA